VQRLLAAAEAGPTNLPAAGPPNYSAHPKSLFRFSHRHLFRVAPNYLLHHLLKLLDLMAITRTHHEHYTMRCTCQVADVKTWTDDDVNEPLQFTLMIYQARWAGGRLGIKIHEAEDEHGDTFTFRLLYFTILRCIGSFIDQHLE
jgi:hypothetical protein